MREGEREGKRERPRTVISTCDTCVDTVSKRLVTAHRAKYYSIEPDEGRNYIYPAQLVNISMIVSWEQRDLLLLVTERKQVSVKLSIAKSKHGLQTETRGRVLLDNY